MPSYAGREGLGARKQLHDQGWEQAIRSDAAIRRYTRHVMSIRASAASGGLRIEEDSQGIHRLTHKALSRVCARRASRLAIFLVVRIVQRAGASGHEHSHLPFQVQFTRAGSLTAARRVAVASHRRSRRSASRYPSASRLVDLASIAMNSAATGRGGQQAGINKRVSFDAPLDHTLRRHFAPCLKVLPPERPRAP